MPNVQQHIKTLEAGYKIVKIGDSYELLNQYGTIQVTKPTMEEVEAFYMKLTGRRF